MDSVLFILFTSVMLLSGLMVVINRNPVASALCLAISFAMLAGLFMLLEAFFLAAVQVLVYAGAVMVLFLFVIMLLDLRAETLRRANIFSLVVAGLLAFAFCFLGFKVHHYLESLDPLPMVGRNQWPVDDVKILGQVLFGQFLLPFLIISLILLVATVGVVHVSRKESVGK